MAIKLIELPDVNLSIVVSDGLMDDLYVVADEQGITVEAVAVNAIKSVVSPTAERVKVDRSKKEIGRLKAMDSIKRQERMR